MAKYIALSPGGTGFYSLIGALCMMSDNDKLSNVEELSGSSAGAIASFMYVVCKGDTDILKRESLETDISEITKLNLKNFFTNYGFIDTAGIREVASSITLRLAGINNPTFQDLYDYNPIKLHIASYCMDTNKTCYFSVDTHPGHLVLDVLCASIAVPMVFSPVNMNGRQYVDGALEEKIPAFPFLHRNAEEILCIHIEFVHCNIEVNSVKNYIQKFMVPLLANRITYTLPTVKIHMDTQDAFDFAMHDKKKLELFVNGYQTMVEELF